MRCIHSKCDRTGVGGRGWKKKAAHTYRADELHLDAGMLQPLAILGSHGDGALDRLAVPVQGRLFATVLVELDIDHGPVVCVLENDVDIDRSREEVRHDGYGWGLLGGSGALGLS